MIGKLLCALPAWLGGGHRWRRLAKKESAYGGTSNARDASRVRICRRCGAERIAKHRKPKLASVPNPNEQEKTA